MSDEPGVNGDVVRYTVKELLKEIRDGIHTIKAVNAAHELRLSKVEQDVGGLLNDRAKYVPIIERLVADIDVDRSVREALADRDDKGFTKRQKMLMLGLGLVQLGLTAIAVMNGI